jgi:cytochrome c biogenesis protein CcdA
MAKLISTEAVWPKDEARDAPRARWQMIAAFAVPAIAVIGLLFALTTFRSGIETAVGDLALLLPVGYAFAAGIVASINPCGLMMLSSYAFFQVRQEGGAASPARSAMRAMLVAAVVTAGFVLVFAVVGGAIAAGGERLVDAFPYAGLVIGIGMVTLGVWLLATRRTLSLLPGKGLSVSPRRSLVNALGFGVTYAIASLSCTLPIFLVVVGGALGAGSAAASFGQFIGYALGMGTAIFVVTVGAALFKRLLARWLRTLSPHVHRLSAMFLVGAGLYLVYYWVFQAGLF